MSLHGYQALEVRDLLIERKAGIRREGTKLGLVIEGGGMRGAMSAGALMAFEDLGLRDCFDGVYATSAGALNGAYFVSGNVYPGSKVYSIDLCDPRFINFRRWPNVLSLDYLFRDVLDGGHERRLDFEAVKAARQPLWITLTHIDSGKPHFINQHGLSVEGLKAVLKATCATPMLTTHWERIDDRLFNDGDIHAAVPVEKAIEDGCTHLVVLRTKEHDYRRSPSKWMVRLEKWRMRRYPQAYRDEFFKGVGYYNASLDAIYSGEHGRPCWAIGPEPGDFQIESYTRRRDEVERVVNEARTRALNALAAQ